jgi:hypothetical protein
MRGNAAELSRSEWRNKKRVASERSIEEASGEFLASRRSLLVSLFVSRFSPLFVSVPLNESTKDSTELLRFVSPDKGVGFVEVASFNSYQDLGSKFSRRTLGDCQESCDLGIAVAFITFRNVRWYGQTAPCELVAKTKISQFFRLLIEGCRKTSRSLPDVEIFE